MTVTLTVQTPAELQARRLGRLRFRLERLLEDLDAVPAPVDELADRLHADRAEVMAVVVALVASGAVGIGALVPPPL